MKSTIVKINSSQEEDYLQLKAKNFWNLEGKLKIKKIK